MALEGSLRDFDLFSMFNMIKTQGKSGTLVLSRGQEFVKVFFDQGDIVGCDSNQVRMEDRLGAMLVRLGRLSGDELMAMIQRQRQTMKRMGTLLLESGKVSPQDLQDALFNQAMSIIYRTFRWIEGDYRFDSLLPQDLDRENFPPIPVDTVLMEAARIMDEWPEVQRRLPDPNANLAKSEYARSLRLDIEQDVASVLDGAGGSAFEGSGLSHEQETVLTYFDEPTSIQGALQITRYDELDTCKIIAELLESGLLELSLAPGDGRNLPAWQMAPEVQRSAGEEVGPSPLLWPLTALMMAGALFFYVPRTRESLNQGLASLQRVDVAVPTDSATRERNALAFRMAVPVEAGRKLARSLGVPWDASIAKLPDLKALPDPLMELPPAPPAPKRGKTR